MAKRLLPSFVMRRTDMIETACLSDRYAAMADEVIKEHSDLQWIAAAGIRIGYLESDREKRKNGKLIMGECIRVKDLYKCLIPYDFLVVVYGPNVVDASEDVLRILLYHELLHVGMSEDGQEVRYVINPHDLEDFRETIDLYGLDWAKH